MRKQSYDPICLDAFEDHSEWIIEDSPPFLTPKEVDALRNDLVNMSLQSALDDLDIFLLEMILRRIYFDIPGEGSTFSSIVQVFVASYKKHHLQDVANEEEGVYYDPPSKDDKTPKINVSEQLK
ncbi:hypothetical protein AHAS_Ahas05G0060800 [Arachis hypogaea]|uniref:Uncharacterized protein n=1 Tax=Arachis hypogaea TaxID=3818 RepID=A0A445D998_ARAHY|nr:hypothetical protein Ahy_A05g025678 [Arachis hypogaea]